MRLVVDMNPAPRWVDWLRTRGHDAVHWSQVGGAGARDREIMDWAKSEDRIVLTHDLDFGSILAATGGHAPSVVQVRAEDLRVEVIGSSIHAALTAAESELASGALVTVDAQRHRVRLLPL